LDLCGAEGFLSCDAVHHTLHRLFVSAFRALHLCVAAKTISKPQPLPPYPLLESRNQLSVVIGEIHNPRLPIPAENPSWLIIPERGLFTGTIMIGATGSGKTAGGMYPFTDQLLGYRAADADAKASALVLEVKGDFCGKVKEILRRRGRGDDYIEIGLDSEWPTIPFTTISKAMRWPTESHRY